MSTTANPRRRRQPIPSYPESLLAWEDNWAETTVLEHLFKIIDEDDFFDDQIGESLKSTLLTFANGMDRQLSARGQDASSVNIFHFLLRPAIEIISDCTSQQLVKKGLRRMEPDETWQFIATLMLRTAFNASTERSWTLMEKHADGFLLMSMDRFNKILNNLRGFNVIGRSPTDEDDSWVRRSNLLRQLNPLERKMFEQSVNILLNKGGGRLVLDDELIASQATDVESKVVSNQKSGKEGPVSDCVACSLTGVLYGMCLRVAGETQVDNVMKLLDTLPADLAHLVRLTFDRGYGKLFFCLALLERGYSVATFAATIGSRHPFIPQAEHDTYKKKLVLKNLSSEATATQVSRYSAWVFEDEADWLGAESRTAKKMLGNGITVNATAVREVFDRKADTKLLRFFYSKHENDSSNLTDVWVAVKKKDVIPSNTLFFESSSKSEKQKELEGLLLTSCSPLTVGQRCADWFLMRSFRITGTLASAIAGQANEIPTNDQLLERMKQCCKIWFNRFKSTASMREGTVNEAPTAEAFALESWVHKFYKVGLLQHNEFPFCGVSPDGLALFSIGEQQYFACVEIKSKVTERTQQAAIQLSIQYGRLVICMFGDDEFTQCVPAEHRGQLVHQAFVCGLDFGIYVVSAVTKQLGGKIVQIVVVAIPQHVKHVHQAKQANAGEPLLRWMYRDDIIARGYLLVDDFPDWMNGDTDLTKLIVSRSRLWYGYMKAITNGPVITPMLPLNLFKLATQFLYNKGKGGLDKSTELEERIRPRLKGTFEAKYIVRMICGVIVNSWQVHQALLIRPRLLLPNGLSIKEMRRSLRNVSIQDYALDLSLLLLKHHYIGQLLPAETPPTAAGQDLTTEADAEAFEAIATEAAKTIGP